MKKRIEKLTPVQEAKLAEYRDKWLAIGLSTEPLDFERAKAAIIKAYEAAKLPAPTLFLHFGDPIKGAIAAVYLKAWVAEVERNLNEVRAQVGAQVRAQVGAQVRAQVWAQVGAQVWDQVRAQVGAQVGDQVGAQVRDQVGDQVWAQVGAQVWAQVGAQVYGYHDANWLGFYQYFRDELGITDCHQLDGLIELAQCCGWWGPYRGFAIMQDRLSICKRDDQGRLHCEDGMAAMYPTGLGWYYWHGVRVPERVIMDPQSITLADILAEKNAEIRRIMAERMGYAKYLHESGAQLIDFDMVDITPNGKQMPRALLKDKFGDYYLEGTDGSTERSYFMRVPATQTCREAHQSLCGLDESLCVAQS